MAELSAEAGRVQRNYADLQSRIVAAGERVGRDTTDVRICVACKYFEIEAMEQLALAGIRLVGENRLQNMVAKQAAFPDVFEWHFIGALQSRKVAEVASRVELIHSVASDSVVERINQLGAAAPGVLVQVNVSGEPSKAGVAPEQLEQFIASLNTRPLGLMTMPPPAADGEASRPYFRALASLAQNFDLTQLSMGTSQDFEVAVEEGATVVRIGSGLFA
ncbi:MAG: YggS family pyridoxal phosphate-dependent enzyme [Thermoleophilaceae bacterium]|nr:YggS family pyridoxal phosphate-dependent enzyme [Thermoleophilaceae bacterium]